MNKLLQFTFTGIVIISLSISGLSQTTDSIEMGGNYANDIFYSFENGEVKSVDRANWDIAFYTDIFSATITINEGSGVELWAYPNGDTSAWNTIDTTGLSTWPKLYNSEETWDFGAFNQNAGSHPDYGWGIYNDITHNLTGDSLFIIKLANGMYKKMWIVKKYSAENRYIFRYGDLDNSNEMEKDYVLSDYTAKNFSYYSISNDELLDREPPRDSWDIVWTKYVAAQPQGGVYPVTGILSNVHVANSKFHPVSLNYSDWLAAPLDTIKSGIGFDWKELDFVNFEYDIVDSTVYFVKDVNDNIYKLYFESFQIGTGKTVFVKQNVSSTDVAEFLPSIDINVYPNPARDIVNIEMNGTAHETNIAIYDVTGKEMISRDINKDQAGIITFQLDQLKEGMYFMLIKTGNLTQSHKIMISN
ncbi:MAG: T9SS type A sorting domain-containing protein [Bacteroidales bacterium]|nr:T9SS type A sorting domain-containing protein [Bacteroidales bacterium]MCF8387287.1 T9SS type A sorting domain-containing protein [Bacteroidales bacterium]MCF8398721.1 T9SS type A sorting domain-containing protein [Bacteroidales bacterium]